MSCWLNSWCGKWEGWARKPINDTNWVAVLTPTDRPKSVRGCCVVELFGGVFVGIGAFVIALSRISFFSLKRHLNEGELYF